MIEDLKKESCKSYTFKVWMAGDYRDAKSACREFTMSGLCVSIHPADFVYTMGCESGFCVTLINYPRFPMTYEDLKNTSESLGAFLCEKLFQGSFTVEGPEESVWFSRRGEFSK